MIYNDVIHHELEVIFFLFFGPWKVDGFVVSFWCEYCFKSLNHVYGVTMFLYNPIYISIFIFQF
jgi:hypothetical protein